MVKLSVTSEATSALFKPKSCKEAPANTDEAITAIVHGKYRRLHTLDSIRGLAAMIVVVHHCFLTQPAFSSFFFTNWQTLAESPFQSILFHSPIRIVWAGYEAVTLFYVLSGLVLALPWIEGHPPSYRSYVIKRVCRIYLPYCASIAFAACLNAILRPWAVIPGASSWINELTWSNPVTLYSLVDHALMIGHRNSINGVIHSLIWEMRVSLLFPLLVLPIARWRARGAVLSATCLLLAVAALQLGFSQPGDPPLLLVSSPELGRIGKMMLELQWTAYYALFFVLGSLLTLHLDVIRHWLTRTPKAGLICLLAGLMIVQAHWTKVHALQETMVAFGSALVIVAGLAPGRIETILSHRYLRFLGRISYSLYLVHVPLLLTSVILLQGRMPMLVVLAFLPLTAVVLGWLFHEIIAEPCVRLGKFLAGKSNGGTNTFISIVRHG